MKEGHWNRWLIADAGALPFDWSLAELLGEGISEPSQRVWKK